MNKRNKIYSRLTRWQWTLHKFQKVKRFLQHKRNDTRLWICQEQNAVEMVRSLIRIQIQFYKKDSLSCPYTTDSFTPEKSDLLILNKKQINNDLQNPRKLGKIRWSSSGMAKSLWSSILSHRIYLSPTFSIQNTTLIYLYK